jgi:quinol monooxygenase YgiN
LAIVVFAAVGYVEAPDAACATEPKQARETVLITYHVVPGKEKELQKVLETVWQAYRKERLVLAQPHVIVRDKESEGKTRIVEIFTWVNAAAPDNAPDSVKKLWDQMKACCEKRDGHERLEGGEVELLEPVVDVDGR